MFKAEKAGVEEESTDAETYKAMSSGKSGPYWST